MTTKRRNIALHIEGVGSSAASSAGIAWHYGRGTIGTPGNYEWIGGTGSGQGLIEPPQSVSTSVDRFECQLRGGAQSFRLHADNVAKGLFLGQPEKPRDTLNTALDEDDTAVVFSVAGYTWSAADDGAVVFIGDEAIKLGTWSAGGTFAGCTRGFWGTTAQAQPAGMNVYERNPKRINRLARILVYDRDAGTTTQAWQGFVVGYTVDNGEISVDCQDVWSMIPGSKINRRSLPAVVSASAATAAAIGKARFIDSPPAGRGGMRVNKSGATRPHWLSYQLLNSLIHAKMSDAADEALLIDVDGTSTGGSLPAMGSPPFDVDSEKRAYELLVVDRLRDEEAGAAVAYTNMRSSTRDLDDPFHPVAIAMAILSSGYSTTPGAPVTPAPTEFGTTVTQTYATQYFTGTGREIFASDARGLTGQCAIGMRLGATASGLKLADDAGGTDWTLDNTALSHTANNVYGIATTADYVFQLFDGNSGSRAITQRIGVADGVVDWTSATGPGSPTAPYMRCCTYIPGEDVLVVGWNDTGNEIVVIDGTAGTITGDSNDTSLTQVVAIGHCDDEGHFLCAGDDQTVEYFALPYTTGDTAVGSINFGAGGDTTLVSGFGTTATSPPPRIVPDRVGDGAWLVPGFLTTTDQPYLYHISGGATPAVDVEITVTDDTGITPATYNWCVDVAVDKYGHVYALLVNGITASDACDVVRYDETGTLVMSWVTDGVTSMPTGQACSITVDEAGTVYIGDRDGYLHVFTQT